MEQRFIPSLLKPEAYPEATVAVQLLQTHVSYLFLTDAHVYKIKKPVDFAFLNFTTLDRRRFYCNEEVRLNRRLCPDLYLGVVDVRQEGDGLSFTGEGTIVDYAVKMRRLPADRMLDRLLAEGRVGEEELRQVARTIAAFHLAAERGPEIAPYGSLDTILANWQENFQQMAPYLDRTLPRADLELIRPWCERFARDHGDLFAARQAGGFIRDCDGDIHAENICLEDDRVAIFDCIEFNPRFRYSDTAADLAFLLMDLEYHDQPRLAAVVQEEYRRATGDDGANLLLPFYKIYRAFVRGKVESFRLSDPQIPAEEQEAARQRALRYFRLARGYVLRERLPLTLFITCGTMGSGKSAVAGTLARELGLPLLRSDLVRKERAAIPPEVHRDEGFNEGLYTAEQTAATYAALQELAEQHLAGGRSVIVDASFRSRTERDACRSLAGRYGARLRILATVCPEEVVRQRLTARRQQPGEVSDGRWEIFPQHQANFEPLAADEAGVIPLDTIRPVSELIDRVLRETELH